MLEIIEETAENSYRKRKINAKDVSKINQYLTKLQKSKEETVNEITCVEDIPLAEVP